MFNPLYVGSLQHSLSVVIMEDTPNRVVILIVISTAIEFLTNSIYGFRNFALLKTTVMSRPEFRTVSLHWMIRHVLSLIEKLKIIENIIYFPFFQM